MNLAIKRKCLALNKDYPNADAHDQRKLDPKASLVDVVLIIMYLTHLIEQIERNANKYDEQEYRGSKTAIAGSS